MIKIDISNRKDKIMTEHKIDFWNNYSKTKDELSKLSNYKNFYGYFFQKGIIDENRIEKLICADSKDELIRMIYLLEKLIRMDSKEQKVKIIEIKNNIEKVFAKLFDRFSKRVWAYKFLKLIKCNVCPYCNRTYTFTINKGGKKSKPELDHYFPKNIYPYLAISIFNIVPACSICNKGKGKYFVRKNKQCICYPYEESFDSRDNKISFTSDLNDILALFSAEKELIIKLDYENTTKDNQELINNYNSAFKIDFLYEQHEDYVRELIQKAMIFDENFFESIFNSLPELFKSSKEVSQAIFANYLEPENMGRRPLAKVTQDILDEFYNGDINL